MRHTLCLLTLVVSSPCGCKKDADKPVAPGSSSAHAAVSAADAGSAPSAAPAESSTAPDAGAPALPAKRTVPAGKGEGGAWTPSFELAGQPNPAPQTFEQALASCKDVKLSLCTEAQWARACELDPALGAAETWTLSMDGPKSITRGGDSCATRRLVGPAETNAARRLVCCSRAVGIETENPNESFLLASAERVRSLEAALTEAELTTLDQLFDEKVVIGGKEMPKAQVTSYYKGRPSTIWSAFDVCTVKLDKQNDRWLAECRITNSTPSGSLTLVVYGGPDGKVQLIGAPDSLKLLSAREEDKGEKKERVRSFLQ